MSKICFCFNCFSLILVFRSEQTLFVMHKCWMMEYQLISKINNSSSPKKNFFFLFCYNFFPFFFCIINNFWLNIHSDLFKNQIKTKRKNLLWYCAQTLFLFSFTNNCFAVNSIPNTYNYYYFFFKFSFGKVLLFFFGILLLKQ